MSRDDGIGGGLRPDSLRDQFEIMGFTGEHITWSVNLVGRSTPCIAPASYCTLECRISSALRTLSTSQGTCAITILPRCRRGSSRIFHSSWICECVGLTASMGVGGLPHGRSFDQLISGVPMPRSWCAVLYINGFRLQPFDGVAGYRKVVPVCDQILGRLVWKHGLHRRDITWLSTLLSGARHVPHQQVVAR